MAFKKIYLFYGLAVIILLIVSSFSNFPPERPITGFWAMEGTLETHIFDDDSDTLSGPELYELQDENGLPIWFGRHIFKDVCISGVCKMIRIWLFWDGTGNFLGFQIPKGDPLTKSDHTKFAPTDYEKLKTILGDTALILGDLKQEDLIIIPDSIDPYKAYEVDGYTAATQPALAEVVVKDAVYSCHTLWHTVYGPVQNAIHEILEERLNEKFLAKMFHSQNPNCVLWAIQSVEKFSEYHKAFYPQILQCLKSENPVLANQALNYFQPSLLSDKLIQNQIVQVMPEAAVSIRYEILWKFIGLKKVDNQVVLQLLEMFEQETLEIGTLNLIYKLVSSEHLKNKEITLVLNTISEHENGYVRNLTKMLLMDKDIPGSNY